MRDSQSPLARLRGLFAGASADAEMREEFESHLAMHIDENIRRGMSPEEARRDALIAAGGMTLAAEAVRERRGLAVDRIARALTCATRENALAQQGLFGGGDSHRGARHRRQRGDVHDHQCGGASSAAVSRSGSPRFDFAQGQDGDMGVVRDRTYAEWERSAKSVAISTSGPRSALFTLGDGAESVDGRNATASYFRVLGVRPRIGRVFTAEEDTPNGPRVIVLSEQFWRRRSRRIPRVIGRVLSVDGKPTTVVGVMPASLRPNKVRSSGFQSDRCRRAPGTTHYFMVTARLCRRRVDRGRARRTGDDRDSVRGSRAASAFERTKPERCCRS